VFLGGVEPRKGLHVALEAWRRAGAHTDGLFSIYGKIVDGYNEVLKPYRALPNVHFHGFTDDAAGVLRAADVLVLPSFEEGSALVTYEAQGCGAVPLVSDATGAHCVDDVNGLVHPAGDVQALTSHFRRLKDEPSLLGRLRAGVLEARSGLTWAAAAERLEHCYELARTENSLAA
jgi:glycosyltransferase involved in cell wall biosynthesis